jgi:hypothetical protein
VTKRAPRKKAIPKPAESEENVFEDDPPLPAVVEESALTQGLTEAEKLAFAKLLKQKMTLEERADCLVELARKKCTKTAAVGLRAIQEINKITGISKDDREEQAAMFVLPPGTRIAVGVETPDE